MRPELAQFADEVRALTPHEAAILDAHTHLGTDEDGHRLDLARLLRQLDQVDVRQACVFPLHDPDRAPAYRAPNDRVLAWADESQGRLIPFCRLDPADGPVAEAERCLARGARGIKLHPRAQAFGFDGAAVDGIFAVAEDAGLPIMIHAGRGLGRIAGELCDVALRHPGAPLVLAHGGIADQGTFATRLADHPAAFFDTSVFGPLDLLELFARVPVERIVYGSDPPYGRPFLGLFATLRCAVAAGLTDAELRAVLGGNMRGVLARDAPATPTAPRRPRTLTMDGSLMRLYTYCAMAFTGVVQNQPASAQESLELASSVCREPDPGPAETALDRIRPVLEMVIAALERDGDRVPADALYLAMTVAATEPVGAS
jgi:predicted TIM-barrel fold metal-dependent hydrolase